MKMVRMNISIPVQLKARLDALKDRGLTTSGYIRNVLEREFKAALAGRKEGQS
jgi:hypothetical protein